MFPDCLDPTEERAENDVYLALEARFDWKYVKHWGGGALLRQARPDVVNAYMSNNIAINRFEVPFTE